MKTFVCASIQTTDFQFSPILFEWTTQNSSENCPELGFWSLIVCQTDVSPLAHELHMFSWFFDVNRIIKCVHASVCLCMCESLLEFVCVSVAFNSSSALIPATSLKPYLIGLISLWHDIEWSLWIFNKKWVVFFICLLARVILLSIVMKFLLPIIKTNVFGVKIFSVCVCLAKEKNKNSKRQHHRFTQLYLIVFMIFVFWPFIFVSYRSTNKYEWKWLLMCTVGKMKDENKHTRTRTQWQKRYKK